MGDKISALSWAYILVLLPMPKSIKNKTNTFFNQQFYYKKK